MAREILDYVDYRDRPGTRRSRVLSNGQRNGLRTKQWQTTIRQIGTIENLPEFLEITHVNSSLESPIVNTPSYRIPASASIGRLCPKLKLSPA